MFFLYFFLMWLYLFLLRILTKYITDRSYFGTKGTKKISIISLLAVLYFIPVYVFFYYFYGVKFSNQKLTKGVIADYHEYKRTSSIFIYKYHIDGVDSSFEGYLAVNEYLHVGDTIDVIYNADDISESFTPSDKYVPFTDFIGWNYKYKKYLDKIKNSGGSKQKYLGE